MPRPDCSPMLTGTNHPRPSGPSTYPRILMSAVSASVPSSPVVSMATMGGGVGGRGLPGAAPGAGTPGGKCCENGRPVSTDPLTGQTICSCQYNPSALLMAASCYPRNVGMGVPGLTDAAGVYSSPYATAAMQGLLPGAPGTDPTAFYSSMGALQGTGYYAYDPFGAYPYGNGFSMDPNARRKNATRESTQTLKAWLSEHRKNPYPTKGEKIMLAIITKMTLTQVSTWFANARRRLKKENKMTWSPRNRCGDDDDLDNDDLDDDDKMNGDDDHDDNDTNNNFADDQSDNDVDILNCGGPADRDSFMHSADFRKVTNNHCTLSKSLLAEDRSADINVLDDDDHDTSDTSGKEDARDKTNTSLGSAFTLVSPTRLPGINGHHRPGTLSPSDLQISPNSQHSHSNKQDSLLERMRHSSESCPKITSPTSSTVTSQKPKIWSVADVVAKSSPIDDRSSDRSHSPSRSPLHAPVNGQHVPHPAFPAPTGHASQHHGLNIARGMGLWNPSVVTSLANMAAAGRYHPYSQGLFSAAHSSPSSSSVLASSRTHFANGGLPASMVPGLMGSPHGGPGGLGMSPHGLSMSASSQPTDLRKNSHLGVLSIGRSSTGSPEGKSMMSSITRPRLSSSEGPSRSRSSSPQPVTAFKPVPRSN